ncbi:hypothetical protein VPH35_012892 [Triticum aestivum]
MCDYTGRKDDPLRHSSNDLPNDIAEDMIKALLNESLADYGRTGLSPFCKTNPAPAADDKFWKVKYDHEAAKKARKAKKAARRAAPRKKGSRPTTSELLQLSDSSEFEDDTGASNPVTEEAKLSKMAKKNKPVEEPVLAEPEVSAQEPPAASSPEATTPTDEPTMETSANPDISSPTQPADDPDVVITRTEFVEPGRPTALAKCSAKEESLERRRAKLDITNYANLSIGEIISGYVNQVHNSRDFEIDMVKQIQQKSEAICKKFEADISELKSRLTTQETETRTANAKF